MNKLFIRLSVFSVILVTVFLVGFLWWKDALSAVNPTATTSAIFVISPGDSVRTIATKLKSAGLIKDQIGFFLLVKLRKLDNKLQAGDFRLSPSMDAPTVLGELTHGTLDVWITTLEGWRDEEIALKLAQELGIPEQEFLKYAREGYMFPDTYLIPKEASAAAVAQMFESNFESRVTDTVRQGIEGQGLTFEEGVILASIVEREGSSVEDKPVIAGILLNRLRDKHPLETDATLQYALGYQSSEKNWWKKSLFEEDKLIKSPYNTYKNTGLPPTPISNPGLVSLQAVAQPAQTDYYYYIHDPKGAVHYAKTIEEHNANVNQFLQ